MVVPWLIADPRFPECRKDIDSRDPEQWAFQVGLTVEGYAIPGIIDIGNLLGTGAYEPPTNASEAELRSNPVNGADGIVTVLFQHRPSLLRRFLDSTQFEYLHFFDEQRYSEDKKRRKPFVILREGNSIEAGYRKGFQDGKMSEDWDSFVRYTILEKGNWRQEYLEYPGIGSVKSSISCTSDAHRVARLTFETFAGHILAFAIKQRRWFRQPGVKIEIKVVEEGGEKMGVKEP